MLNIENSFFFHVKGPESPKDKKGLAVEGDEIDINPVDLENNDAEESDPLLTTDIVLKSDEVVIEMAGKYFFRAKLFHYNHGK